MQREIANGVEAIQAHLDSNKDEQIAQSWRALRNRLDSILLSTNVMKSDETKRQCLVMDTMTSEKRKKHISEKWGGLYLERVTPILHQLDTLERKIKGE
jgi:hypothetical protein